MQKHFHRRVLPSHYFPRMDTIYGLLTKCEVKMAGYWLRFFCVFMDRDGVEVQKLAAKKKKERGQYPAILTEQTWSIKDLVYGFREIFLAGYIG